MRTSLLTISLILISCGAFAKTTVVEVLKDDFPYDQATRVYVHDAKVYLECRDEYLDTGRKQVNVEGMLAGLKKLQEWMELNKTVKAEVTKRINLVDPTAEKISFTSAHASFHALESGLSFAIISVGENCSLNIYQLTKLIEGIEANLEKAFAEEAKNKEDLFN